MVSIRTIVFDFGNVLGFFSHRRGAEQLAAFGPPELRADDILTFLFFDDLEDRFERAKISSFEVLALLRSRFELNATDDQLALAAGDIFTPNRPVCDLVPRLQGRYRLALLSNTNDLHYRVFRRQFADTLDRFDHLVASHLVGLRKPEPEIYRHVEQLTGTAPAECLFIDDLATNREAAEALGWGTLDYRPGDDLARALAARGVTLAA